MKRAGTVKARTDMKRRPGAMQFLRGLLHTAKRGGTAGHYALVLGHYVRGRVLILIGGILYYMEKVVNLAKQRGFVFPGSEIYGGLANTWDYGPLGIELKNNIKKAWW